MKAFGIDFYQNFQNALASKVVAASPKTLLRYFCASGFICGSNMRFSNSPWKCVIGGALHYRLNNNERQFENSKFNANI